MNDSASTTPSGPGGAELPIGRVRLLAGSVVTGHYAPVSSAVRIPLGPASRDSFFDLKEVMDAVGEHAELAWSLSGAQFNGDVTSLWSDGPVAVEHRSNEAGGVDMSWMSMRQLALGCRQIIDGTFVGRTDDGLPQLLLSVFDSSYWVVWAAEDSITERVRERFSNVEDIEISPPVARS